MYTHNFSILQAGIIWHNAKLSPNFFAFHITFQADISQSAMQKSVLVDSLLRQLYSLCKFDGELHAQKAGAQLPKRHIQSAIFTERAQRCQQRAQFASCVAISNTAAVHTGPSARLTRKYACHEEKLKFSHSNDKNK